MMNKGEYMKKIIMNTLKIVTVLLLLQPTKLMAQSDSDHGGVGNGGGNQILNLVTYQDPQLLMSAIGVLKEKIVNSQFPDLLQDIFLEEIDFLLSKSNEKFMMIDGDGVFGYQTEIEGRQVFRTFDASTKLDSGAQIVFTRDTLRYEANKLAKLIAHEILHHLLTSEQGLNRNEEFIDQAVAEIFDPALKPSPFRDSLKGRNVIIDGYIDLTNLIQFENRMSVLAEEISSLAGVNILGEAIHPEAQIQSRMWDLELLRSTLQKRIQDEVVTIEEAKNRDHYLFQIQSRLNEAYKLLKTAQYFYAMFSSEYHIHRNLSGEVQVRLSILNQQVPSKYQKRAPLIVSLDSTKYRYWYSSDTKKFFVFVYKSKHAPIPILGTFNFLVKDPMNSKVDWKMGAWSTAALPFGPIVGAIELGGATIMTGITLVGGTVLDIVTLPGMSKKSGALYRTRQKLLGRVAYFPLWGKISKEDR